MNSIMQAQETARERLIMEKDAAIQEMQALGIELSTSQQQITKLEEAIGEVEAKVRESALRYCGYRRQMKWPSAHSPQHLPQYIGLLSTASFICSAWSHPLSWSFGLFNFVSARCCETRISECKWGTQSEEGKDEGVQCANQCISCSTGRLESEACWLKPPGKETW